MQVSKTVLDSMEKHWSFDRPCSHLCKVQLSADGDEVHTADAIAVPETDQHRRYSDVSSLRLGPHARARQLQYEGCVIRCTCRQVLGQRAAAASRHSISIWHPGREEQQHRGRWAERQVHSKQAFVEESLGPEQTQAVAEWCDRSAASLCTASSIGPLSHPQKQYVLHGKRA